MHVKEKNQIRNTLNESSLEALKSIQIQLSHEERVRRELKKKKKHGTT